jgi:hypothetical protein
MSHKKFYFILIAGMLLLACACSFSSTAVPAGTSAPGSTGLPTQATVTLAPISARQGDLVSDGDLRVMVHGWTEMTLTRQPDSGQKFIGVDFSVVNAGKAPLEIFGNAGSWSLQDAEGNSLPFYKDFLPRDMIASGLVYPGEKIRSTFIYQVPAADGQFSLMYTNSRLPALAPITITLNGTAGISDPSGAIEGEVPPTVDAPGETVTHGDWQIQVLGMKVTQPCQERYSKVNCTKLPPDILNVHLDLAQKNLSSQSLTITMEGMFWLEDPAGRRFGGESTEVGLEGLPVNGGSGQRFSADFLVWPGASTLYLGFRYRLFQTPVAGDYVCIALPAFPAP